MAATMELVRKRIARAEEESGSNGTLQRFSDTLFDKADDGFLESFDTESLFAMAVDGLRFLSALRNDTMRVQVFHPNFAADGWESPYTVVRLALADRPFIVDSVQAEIRRRGHELVHQLHPIVAVRRDDDGKLLDVEVDDVTGHEAFEMFFLDRIDDEATLERLETAVRQVLGDVVLATDDYARLRERAGQMATYLHRLAKGDTAAGMGASAEELEEYASFIEWLDDDNFVFLGYREYDIVDVGGEPCLRVDEQSGLGILRKLDDSGYREPVPLSKLPTELRERVTGGRLFIVTKTNAESTVHRARRMDYVGVKKLAKGGEVVGEQRFVGLFTTKAQNASVEAIPILRRKLRQVLDLDQAIPGSHDYKGIVAAFNSMPREDLFWSDAEQIHKDIRTILRLEQERGARLTLRSDPLKRGIAAMVIMPRESFNADVRRSIQAFLQERLAATRVDYRLALGEDQSQARFHFFFTTDIDPGELDVKDLERTIVQLARSWQEELRERLLEASGERAGRALANRYADAFDDRYRAHVTPNQALRDIANLERLEDRDHVIDLINPVQEVGEPATTLLIYHVGHGLPLSDVMPLMENLGFRVIEQNPYNLTVEGASRGIDVFRVQDHRGEAIDVRADRERLIEAMEALLAGDAESDRLNRLVLDAKLDVRQVALLRAYQMYYAQLNLVTSRSFVNSALLAHPGLAARLMAFFEARFDPARGTIEERAEAVDAARQSVVDGLGEVASLAEDQVLRGLLDLMEATVRTNYFLGHERISFKLESARVGTMPEPRPLYEIAVMARGVEGTHLRGGKVARGGIRWSDRPDDFRTEVLGLMKTQMTKNAVIVPVGSKGGFVVKSAPAGRDAVREYVREQYQTYIRSLLDITDNLVDGVAVHPDGVVVYDGDDPYLVVAADKGTATFSDTANAISAEYGFWLGDAFASGGSAGYDHKGMGITARGTWECVKRHFAEEGVDVFQDPFTVVGIGDMSGDVFGNGLLYTDRIRLVAAFNHLHVFLDPDPDPRVSFEERKRLFEMPRSTWADYDAKRISRGGGVYERSAKRIELTPEVRALLGVEEEALSGQDLIRAVLKLPVDLLWNGGIGTYVKASTERHAEVGDSANDGVRIDATELRCKIVGEGGNLGFTQLARIEYARLGGPAQLGGRIDTDAIHNSAGVDTSDHEVNIKILLQPMVTSGEMSEAQRNRLLPDMTDEVASLVLRHNAHQSRSLSMAERASKTDLAVYGSLLEYLVESAGLNPRVEYLPTRKQLDERRRSGEGLTRPELSVMLAYVKMGLYRRLLETDLPDEAHLQHYLFEYFPSALRERAAAAIETHPLRREITATVITNTLVDLLGMVFVHRAMRDNGAGAIEVVRAALVALEVLDARAFAEHVEALESKVPMETTYDALTELVGAVEGVVSWMLFNDIGGGAFDQVVGTYRDPLRTLRGGLEGFLPAAERRRFRSSVKHLLKDGHDEATANEIASLEYLPASVGVIEVARRTGVDLERAATRFYALGERLSLGWMRDVLSQLPTTGAWEKMAVMGLVMDLRETQQRLTAAYVAALGEEPNLGLDVFLRRLPPLRRFDQALGEVREPGALNLASAAVMVRMLGQACTAAGQGRRDMAETAG